MASFIRLLPFTHLHGLGLSHAHFDAVILCRVTAATLLAVGLAATLHKLIVDLLAVSEEIAALKVFAVNGKGTVDAVIGVLRLDRESSQNKKRCSDDANHVVVGFERESL